MAVYCGVCAIRIFEAIDNEGSFQVAHAFANGWDPKPNPSWKRTPPLSISHKIDNTCGSCAEALRLSIAETAKVIAGKYQDRILTLKNALAERERVDAELEKDRQEFEAAWRAARFKRS
jgi:hypothetical protein